MPRWLKYTLTGLVIFLGVIALVIVLAFTTPVQTYIAKRVLTGVNKNLTGKLSFGSVHVSINGDLKLSHLSLQDSTGQSLLALENLEVSINPLALRRNRIYVRKLLADQLVLALEFDSTGTNIQRALAPRNPAPKPAQQPTTQQTPWRIRVADLRIRGARTSLSKGDTVIFQTDAWNLKGDARYVNDTLKYTLATEVPERLNLNTDGTLYMGNPFTPIVGHLSLVADTSIIALLPLPASTLGEMNLTLSFASSMDSLKLNADLRGSKFGRVTLHGAGQFPVTRLALRGDMTFDSLTPGAMWSDTTGMMLFGNINFSKAAANNILDGWKANVNLKSSRYGRYNLASAKLKIRTEDSTVTLDGDLDTGDGRAQITSVVHGFLPADPRVTTTIKLESLNLHRLLPQIPDSLLPISGIITAQGSYIDPQHVNGAFNTELGPITLGSYTVDSLIIHGAIQGQNFRVDTVRMMRDSLRFGLSAAGKIGGDLQYTVAASIPNLHDLKKILPRTMPLSDTLGGRLVFGVSGTGSLKGNRPHGFTASGGLRLTNAVYGADTVQYVEARIQRFDMDSMAVHGDFVVRGLKASGQSADSILLTANGTMNNMAAVVQLWARADTIQLYGNLGLKRSPERMELTIDTLSGKYVDITFATEGENSLALAGKRLDVNGLTIVSNVGILRAQGTLQRNGNEDFALELSGLQTEKLAKLFKMPPTQSIANLRVQVLGPDNDLTGDISLVADSIVMNDQPVADQFTLHAVTDARRTVVNGQMNWLGDTTLIFNAEVPVSVSIEKGLAFSKTDPIKGRLQLLQQRLDKFNRYLSKEMQMAGLISADITVGGTMDKPTWQGVFAVQKGAYRDSREGIKYQDIAINGTVDGDTLRIPNFNFTSKGKMTGSGWAIMALPVPTALHLDVNANKFQAVNRENMRVRLSGKMSIDGPLNQLDAKGNLTIDDALYRLTASATKQVEPIDVKAEIAHLGGDTTHQNFLPSTIYQTMSHNLTLYIPGNTWIKGQGMNIALSGNLQILKSRGDQMPTLAGEIDVDRGSVTYYGHEFQVEGGTSFIRFEGPPDNPALDITATDPRLADRGVDISIRLFGTLKKMQLSLAGSSGQDSLSAAQIAQLLTGVNITGERVPGQDTTKTSESTQVESAATGAATGQLAGFLGRAAGLDVLRFNPGGQGGVQGLTQGSLEVGTYLTERLFVQVVQPIQETDVSKREVSLEYRLFRWLNLRAQQIGAGESAFDLLMRFDWR